VVSNLVAVFGDLNIDLLLRVDYIPTADIAISAKELRIRHGGVGGNVAVALSRLGLKVRLIGAVGADIFGSQVVEELRKEGIDVSYVKRINIPTGIMVVLVTPTGARSIIGFRGANKLVSLSDEEIDNALRGVKHLHLSGYMALNDDRGELLLKLAKVAKELKLTISIDLEGIATERREMIHKLKGLIDYALLNKDELRYLSGTNDVEEGIKYLLNVLSPKAVFIKLGPKGSIAASRNTKEYVPAFKIRAVDSTGAGDAYNAGIIYSLLRGLTLSDAALFGNAMGAFTCLGHGARYLPRSVDELITKFPIIRRVVSPERMG